MIGFIETAYLFLKNNVASAKNILQFEEKRIKFIRKHADKIINFISAFNVKESGVETPISNGNYINWYGEYHKSHGNISNSSLSAKIL